MMRLLEILIAPCFWLDECARCFNDAQAIGRLEAMRQQERDQTLRTSPPHPDPASPTWSQGGK